MDKFAVLLGFIETAKAERKYADSTARGLKAAVKLFGNYVSNAERESFDVLLQNLDNIAADIYAKHADENITVTTLVVYKRRIRKLVGDFHEYGSSPDKMAGWNPRRPAPAMKPKRVEQRDEPAGAAPVLLRPAHTSSTNEAGLTAMDTGDSTVIMNRSEISLRRNLRFALELPADMTEQEANKIKQLIDIMVTPE